MLVKPLLPNADEPADNRRRGRIPPSGANEIHRRAYGGRFPRALRRFARRPR